MGISAETMPVGNIREPLITEMFELMGQYYENVYYPRFTSDLSEKDWVILLRDGSRLCGFSTQKLFNHHCLDRNVRIVFSGDTIIRRENWNSFALAVSWGRLMLSILDQDPKTNLYWLLTSKGYKTYRFLPSFFKDFSPSHLDNYSDFEVSLLKSVAQKEFGSRFDPNRLILKASTDSQHLKKGVAEIDDVRRKDEHVKFFEGRNPNHFKGDELVCIARFHMDNLTPWILKRLEERQ